AYLGHQVAAALSYAHQKRDDLGQPLAITHRDVSPHNIMVSHAGTVKLLDFGIAKQGRVRAQSGHPSPRDGGTQTVAQGGAAIHGKLAYMSPEQALGLALDCRTDLYSLGVVLYELLSGKLVHRTGDVTSALERVRAGSLPPLAEVAPEVPAPLAAVVTRALQREPADRWASAREMQSALARFLHRADPVVDDEVLSSFLDSHLAPAQEPTQLPEVGPTQIVSRPDVAAAARGDEREVIVLRARLVPQLQTAQPPDVEQLGRLVAHLAETRGAEVIRRDSRDICLAFGAIAPVDNPTDQALGAALALSEAVAQVGHGLGLGIAIAKLQAHVAHQRLSGFVVTLPELPSRVLATIAEAGLDGPVWVCGSLADEVAGLWAFDRDAPHPAPHADTFFSGGAALAGAARERDQRIAHPPGRASRLYGREIELRTLRNCLTESLRSSQVRAALIVGEPGLGKQALLRTFLRGLPTGAFTVVQVVGQWRRRNISLATLIDVLRQLLELPSDASKTCIDTNIGVHVRDSDRRATFVEALHAALNQPPGAHTLRTDPQRPWQRRELLWQLTTLVASSRARTQPVVLVVENLHLIDDHSFQRLRSWLDQRLDSGAQTGSRVGGCPMVCLLSSRPGDREQLLRRNRGLSFVHVLALDTVTARDMITQRFADPEAGEDLARSIVARTGGNPLFIEETLAALLHRDVIGWDPQGYLHIHKRNPTVELPRSIEAALKARLDALSPQARDVLEAAAVLGYSFRVAELHALVERDCSAEVTFLREHGLFEAGQKATQARMRFASRSLHDVCKTCLAGDTARARHRAAADLKLARRDYTPGRDDGPVADHFAQAESLPQAIDPALRAAAHAREAASNVEAYYYLSLALSGLSEEDSRRVACLLQRDDILRTWGRRRAQGANLRQLTAAIASRPDPAAEVIALTRLLRFYLECDRIATAEQLLPRVEQAIARQEAHPTSERGAATTHLARLQLAELHALLW
ncbi:MAG: protein kinase domain-containing protein, partial [Nannocystaceae bacterium]